MKIVKFKGGLGNQLFQYAFLRTLELKYGIVNVKGDFSYYTDITNDGIRVPRIEKFNVKINKADSQDLSQILMFRHTGNPLGLGYKIGLIAEILLNRQYYFEWDRQYRNVEQLLGYDYFDGYWQSWRYWNDIEDIIKKEIVLTDALSERAQATIDKINKENAVFVSIRRGDYVASSRDRKHYGSFGPEYYEKAIDHIKERVSNPVFYIFSNDIPWVKQNMRFDCMAIFRDQEEQTNDTEELLIMSSCQHAIIANSTFSWWGAWLIENKDKIVIAPANWFADDKPIDIIPNTWLRM